MAETIFLIDGMYLLFSSFYSNRNMRTLQGDPTGGVYGFITRTESLIKELEPDRIAVAMDGKEKTFRHKMYEPYKAKRLAAPEELIQQMPHVKNYINLRGINLYEVPGFEADDIIANIAKQEAKKGNQVIIFTADKDLFQLVGDSIYIYHPKSKQKLDPEGINEQFGVSPQQVVDFLSLMGDSSDNIPGVPGVGEKTAKRIIENYGSVQGLLDAAEFVDKKDEKVKTKITDNLELYTLSRELIDLSKAPDFEQELLPEPFKDEIQFELLDLFRTLSFNSLLKRFSGQIKESPPEASTQLDITYNIVKTNQELDQLVERTRQIGYFAFDLETTALEFYKSDIVGISLSFLEEGYYVPFKCSAAEAKDVSVTFEDFKEKMSDIFLDPQIKKTGHNLKFDILHLKHLGMETEGVADDSMVMSYLLQPNRRAHSLKDLTFELLQYRQTEFAELTGKGKVQKQLITVDLDTISKYCIDDSYLTLKLIEMMEDSIKDKELSHLYQTIEMPLIKVLTAMEYNGVQLDIPFLKDSAKSLQDKISSVAEEIYQIAGKKLNLNSSQQLGELLFEKMNLPVKKKTRKTKSFSTDNEVLSELKDYPVVARIIEYRSYKKLLSTYLEGLIESVDHQDRVHGSFNQTVTATGRLSSSNPNLQNIPVGETGGVNVRDAFVAGEDNMLLAADYSQVELRVMAHFSEDPNLMDAFSNDFDIHKHTADTVFAGDLFADAQEKRKRAKIINFSVLYGTGPFSLSKELGVSYKEAKNFIEMYFEKHAGVKAFIEKVISEAEANPEVKTISGRLRAIPEIVSSNRTVKENGKRMAINTVIQGSAADIIKIAMINIQEKLTRLDMKSLLVMQVHDELVFQYPQAEEEQLLKLVKDEMENAITLKVPLKVTLKTGKTWGHLS